MTGSIVKRTAKDGSLRYHAVYYVGGKNKWKSFTKRKAAERFLTSVVKTVQDGNYQAVIPTPMKEVFAAWQTDCDTRLKMRELKPSTAKSYKSMVATHFVPAFGDYRSDQLSAAAVKQWRATMADQIASGKLARKSFNNLLNLLHSILDWARDSGQRYLSHDPLIRQKRLKPERVEAEFLEDADMKALLGAVVDSTEQDAIIHVALFAGLRRGEVFALQWGDLEWGDGKHGGRLRVRRSLYQGEITAPKTVQSERTVDLPQRVLDVLARHRPTPTPESDHFVFCTAGGTPIDPDNFYKRTFSEIRTRAGLRATVGLHTLRHTYASLLIRQNESPKYVSRQLGHATIAITMDTYGHLFTETSMKAMKQLNKMIPERTPPAPVVARRALRVVGGRG